MKKLLILLISATIYFTGWAQNAADRQKMLLGIHDNSRSECIRKIDNEHRHMQREMRREGHQRKDGHNREGKGRQDREKHDRKDHKEKEKMDKREKPEGGKRL